MTNDVMTKIDTDLTHVTRVCLIIQDICVQK